MRLAHIHIAVNRHTGGLEKLSKSFRGWQHVNRHTGGLEKIAQVSCTKLLVNRHTGGLEIPTKFY